MASVLTLLCIVVPETDAVSLAPDERKCAASIFYLSLTILFNISDKNRYSIYN